MNLITKNIFAAMLLLGCSVQAVAQAPGSETIYGGPAATLNIESGTTTTEVAETLYIGPGSYNIEGTWAIYSKNVVIDPGAVMSGSGSIVFYNPSDGGGAASVTFIDGNGSAHAINVNMVLQNASGVQLTNIDFPTDLTSAGFANGSSNNLYLGADLSLAVDGANVDLNNNDLVLGSAATISHYSPQRFVITDNGITGHLVKEGLNGPFIFPVGIVAGDYTPAQVTTTTTDVLHVSVQDYAASIADEAGDNGMDRTWNIYADGGSGATIALQHNSITNQPGFNDSSQFVTQWSAASPNTTGDLTASATAWQSNTPAAGATGDLSSTGTVAGSSVMSRAYASLPTGLADATAYFSKSSSTASPLPVTLLSFDAVKAGNTSLLTWETSSEQNTAGFEVEHSMDSKSWTKIGYVESLSEGGFSRANLNYRFVDAKPETGRNFYRLKMVDVNGRFTYSEVRSVWFGNERKITVYPNPFSGMINIEGLDGNEDILIFDVLGRMMYRKQADGEKQQINLEGLSDGSYQIRIVSGEGMQSTFKVKKVK